MRLSCSRINPKLKTATWFYDTVYIYIYIRQLCNANNAIRETHKAPRTVYIIYHADMEVRSHGTRTNCKHATCAQRASEYRRNAEEPVGRYAWLRKERYSMMFECDTAEEGAAKIRLDLAGSLAVGPLLCNEAVHTVERISLYMKMCKTINNHKRRNTRNVHTRQVAYE